MSKWYSFKELKRARTPMPLDSVAGLPDNHVITVVERVISVDDPELIQNNVRTDTFTLNLDAEYDDLNVVVIFTKPNNINVKVAYNGTPTHIPGSAMELVGSLACSVVGIDADGEVRAVTKAAPDTFQVVKSGAYDGSVTSDDAELLGQILQAVSDAETAITEAETATTAATNATTQATSAATSANKAASSANSAASSANSAATRATSAAVNAENAYDTLQPYMATIDSCANVLHREVGPDAVVTADDSFPCKPVEMTVYGNTVQNLWVNPSGVNAGVTATANADGSVTVSGTASDIAIVSGSVPRYILKPNTQYTLSVDKAINLANTGFRVLEKLTSSAETINHALYGSSTSLTFTTSSDLQHATFEIRVNGGDAVSGTYRVMLNEGSTAEPWCPPGLNSVGEGGSVKVVTAGKNLVRQVAYAYPNVVNDLFSFDDNSITVVFDVVGGETYTFSSDPAPDRSVYGYIDTNDIGTSTKYRDKQNASISGNTINITADRSGAMFLYVMSVKNESVAASSQVELGSTATAYEPPSITTTSIDLQGHTLNALPDGTCDELHIDGGGNVVLEKRCGDYVADAEDWISGSGRAVFNPTDGLGKVTATNLMSEAFPVIGAGAWVKSRTWAAIGADGYVQCNIANEKDENAIKNVCLGKRFIYPLAEPQIIDLGTITPPTMAAPNVTAYVADDTPAEMELDYVRDINIVVDRLEKKVADLVVTEATIV